jgi:wyosine [tRNA(Phe)-imidazoG37] synthetase (radical SAM superfamily)
MSKPHLHKDLHLFFCEKPFEFFEIGRTHDGHVQTHVCCPAWLPLNVGDISKLPLERIWNSKLMQRIRQSMLDGTYSFCNKNLCPKINTGTLMEKSQITDPFYRDIIDNNKVVMDKGPKILNLSNDRSCNLTCPSCRTDKEMLSAGPEYDRMVQVHDRLMEESIKDLKHIIFCSNGDPFASKLYRKMMFEIDGSINRELEVQIVTNGLLFNEGNWNRLEKIHDNKITVFCSVDAATPETYRITRRGGELEDLIPNLEFLAQKRKEEKINYLQLDFVVQDYNYAEMKQFVELGKRLGVDRVYFQRIINWGTYSEADFLNRMVYDEHHPDYEKFIMHLKDPIFEDEIVNMGNVEEFRQVALNWKS